MALSTFYGYWLNAFAGALDTAIPADDRRAAALAAEAGTLTTDEFTRVQHAIMQAVGNDDDTDEGTPNAE